jgi:hypothetical protein
MIKNCEHCEKLFKSRDRMHRFCCQTCQQKAYLDKRGHTRFEKTLIKAANDLEITNIKFINNASNKIRDEQYSSYLDIIMYLTLMCEDNNIKYTLDNLVASIKQPLSVGIIKYTYPTIFLGEDNI